MNLVNTGVWHYTYFANGDLNTLQTPSGETTTYAYDGADRLARRTNGDGTYQNIGYDAASQTTDLWYYTSGGGVQGHLAYAHTPAGQISSLTQGSAITSYSYDGANQLTAETHSGDGAGMNYSHGFTYDSNGNRKTQTTNGAAAQSFTYDANNKLVSGTAGNETPGFDANGNQVSQSIYGGTSTQTFDDEDRMVRLTSSGGIVDTYTYNGLGLRVGKSIGANTYSYVCDGTSAGSPVLSDGHATFTAGLSSTVAGVTSSRHEDALGSLRFLTDSSQSVTGSGLFEAFGAPVGATGINVPFGWVGGADCQTEADTGLVLMGHRYYDSRVGRFISQDPAGDGDNWYSYCGNDPINGLDPTGLSKQSDLYWMMWASGDYHGGAYHYSEDGNGINWWSNTDSGPQDNGIRIGQGVTIPGGGMSLWDALGNAVDQEITFGAVTHAGNMAGAYDSGKVSRGAAIGAGALAVGAIVAAGASDGEDAAAVDATRPFAGMARKDLLAILNGKGDLLRELFGQNIKGAEAALKDIPHVEGLTKDVLHAYREIGLRQIKQGLDSSGVHGVRIQIINKVLSR